MQGNGFFVVYGEVGPLLLRHYSKRLQIGQNKACLGACLGAFFELVG